jgi:dihydrofolate reductase
MRTVTYGAACSLDGFIAGPQGEIDWLHMSSDVSSIMAKYWTSVDTILMGRKTYDVAQAMGGGPATPGVTGTYVFSRTLGRVVGAQLVRDDAGAFVRALKQKPGKDICLLGGGELARSLFAEGVIDEVGLNIQPVLLGGGCPLFPDIGKRIRLDLIESRTIDGGCVLASYRVVQ